MKHYMKAFFSSAVLALLAATSVQAGSEEKLVIALKTGDFELQETDVSELVIGESQTIETDSGKIIDILRTADGVELYLDGELLEMNFSGQGLHEDHIVQKHVEIICDDEESSCSKDVVIISDGEDFDLEELHEIRGDGENHKIIVIKKEVIAEE